MANTKSLILVLLLIILVTVQQVNCKLQKVNEIGYKLKDLHRYVLFLTRKERIENGKVKVRAVNCFPSKICKNLTVTKKNNKIVSMYAKVCESAMISNDNKTIEYVKEASKSNTKLEIIEKDLYTNNKCAQPKGIVECDGNFYYDLYRKMILTSGEKKYSKEAYYIDRSRKMAFTDRGWCHFGGNSAEEEENENEIEIENVIENEIENEIENVNNIENENVNNIENENVNNIENNNENENENENIINNENNNENENENDNEKNNENNNENENEKENNNDNVNDNENNNDNIWKTY